MKDHHQGVSRFLCFATIFAVSFATFAYGNTAPDAGDLVERNSAIAGALALMDDPSATRERLREAALRLGLALQRTPVPGDPNPQLVRSLILASQGEAGAVALADPRYRPLEISAHQQAELDSLLARAQGERPAHTYGAYDRAARPVSATLLIQLSQRAGEPIAGERPKAAAAAPKQAGLLAVHHAGTRPWPEIPPLLRWLMATTAFVMVIKMLLGRHFSEK